MARQIETLEQIIKHEQKHRNENGLYGVNACRDSVKARQKIYDKTLFELLGYYYERYKTDPLFNTAMILATWEMINEQ